MRLTGMKAIEAAKANPGVVLCSHTDPTEEGRVGLTIAEAEAIARQDPGLVYAEQAVAPTREPVTAEGWYEHTDETWGYYYWNSGRVHRAVTVAAGAPRPTASERLAADAALYEADMAARRVRGVQS
jgi:hypothetical protein